MSVVGFPDRPPGDAGPPPPPVRFAELVAATNFSFLDGASHPTDMVEQAVRLGLNGLGIADRNTVAGVVRAWAALEKANLGLIGMHLPPVDFRLVTGARLVFADGTPDIVAYPATRHGWGMLTRLLTVGNRRAIKGGCILRLADLIAHHDELLLIVMPQSSAREREQEAHPGAPTDPIPTTTPSPTPAKAGAQLRVVGGTDAPFSEHADERANGDAKPSPPDPPQPGRGLRRGELEKTLATLTATAPDRVWLGAAMPRAGRDRRQLARLAEIAREAGVPLLATADALYATRDQRPLHDVVTCIREGRTIRTAGRLLAANGERHLKDGDEIARLFRDHPHAVAESERLLARIDFSLDQLKYEYPHEPVPDGWAPQEWLEHLVWRKALDRYDDRVPAKVLSLLNEEFALIAEQNYAYYFLTVYDIVRFARSLDPPILCQGRGSAANSVVCFLLGVTSVDPMKYDLLFSRFVSKERSEPPDIDVDFEHERREEVMQYIYRRYGRHRAAIAATVIHYRPRSTVREVGKALGLTEDVTQRLTSTVWGSFADRFEAKRFAETGFDSTNAEIARLQDMVGQLLKFPRHLSQHVGGYVLTQGRLDETVPIHNGAMEDRTFIEWDKDDIDALGLMKVDVLALGMLTCIRKAFDLMRDHGFGDPQLDTLAVEENASVYRMLQDGDSIGVFQVESRAQINMLPRLKPREFYDLVVQVAIVRPGPIEGDMVHPYLRRRAGKEPTEFPSPKPPHNPDELRDLLHHTYGVPLFQEQAMKLAIVAAQFTPEEANALRRAMATFRQVGGMENFKAKLVGGMVRRGYDEAFAERCYSQIEGFGSYGFPESHALSFARLVYVSSWIKCFLPAVFGCAILNSQPMGFYAPAQLVQDAIEHGVEAKPIDVNHSGWDNLLEPITPGWRSRVTRAPNPAKGGGQWDPRVRQDGDLAIRLGFRQIDGFRADWGAIIAANRPYACVEDLARHLPPRAMRLLADADALGSLGLGRREGGWEVRRTPPKQLPLFAAADAPELAHEPDAKLPPMPLGEEVVADYQTTRLSLKDHPMRFLRDAFAAEGIITAAEARNTRDGRRAKVAGVVLVRQRPGKGNAIFITIEDETGVTNGLIWARDFEANRRDVMAARLLVLEGVIQRSEEGVVHLMAKRVQDRTNDLRRLSSDYIGDAPLSPADEVIRPKPIASQDPRGRGPRPHHPRDVRIMPPSRDFH
ncbi:error-prone DNA polymerase [Sphingomonas jinjuensis]|uniref:Error-prone DNA polymerase n=1 Tax=Sphingomonas jinjuensis TaxID=535907 RepID=A0A840FEI9_9SPHN|nr:error-prone DNA polymerase [Sphingomonas jinjuensis]MBB4152428.1 error-prone DNA polymerase [Sphingomonas jinjuensis]